jgi:phosphoribosyl 1,2-cyclic phosphodiesterase
VRFAVLGSGSQGNGTLIASADTSSWWIVVSPCGKPSGAWRALGVNPAQLSAILVTHEHADHVHGVGLLSRRYNLPVYLSQGTLRGMRKPVEPAGFSVAIHCRSATAASPHCRRP